MPSKAAIARRNAQCLQVLALDGQRSWNDLQFHIEDIKLRESKCLSAGHYRIGRPFACPAYDSKNGYYFCMVTAYSPRQCKGEVTFMRPDIKRGEGHFVAFQKTCTTETVPFDALANALVPLPYTLVQGRRMKLLIPLSRQISVFLKYGGVNSSSDLLTLSKTAYAVKMLSSIKNE